MEFDTNLLAVVGQTFKLRFPLLKRLSQWDLMWWQIR